MNKRKWIGGISVLLVILILGLKYYAEQVGNPKVISEIMNNPAGVRAAIVTLIELPDGRSIPANYLREGNLVFIGVDGRWWREFNPGPTSVSLLIKGIQETGTGVVVLDDPAYTHEIFARLRPDAPAWLPDWLNGKLVVITLSSKTMPDGV